MVQIISSLQLDSYYSIWRTCSHYNWDLATYVIAIHIQHAKHVVLFPLVLDTYFGLQLLSLGWLSSCFMSVKYFQTAHWYINRNSYWMNKSVLTSYLCQNCHEVVYHMFGFAVWNDWIAIGMHVFDTYQLCMLYYRAAVKRNCSTISCLDFTFVQCSCHNY